MKFSMDSIDLNFIKKVKSETMPTGLVYSTDGKLLMAGTGTRPCNINIYQSKNSYKKKISFKKHNSLTMAVAFLDKHTAVSGGGENYEINLIANFRGLFDCDTIPSIAKLTNF